MTTLNEHLARERLKGLQSKEREVNDLKRELAREKDLNDALVEANRTGRQNLIKFKQRITLSQEQVIELQGQLEEAREDITMLKAQREQDEVARLRGELIEANRCNENQRQLIQTLRKRSATALIQRIRDDMAAVKEYQTTVTLDHLRQILDAYERELDL